MCSAKQSQLKVTTILMIPIVIVAVITVLLIIKDRCVTDNQLISKKSEMGLQSDELPLRQKQLACDLLLVVRGHLKDQISDNAYGESTKIYRCAHNDQHHNELLERNYECMFYGIQNSSRCGGYLFLGHKLTSTIRDTKTVERNDRSRIWRTNNDIGVQQTLRFDLSLRHWLRLNESNLCKTVIREIAILNYVFSAYEERYRGSWRRPWNPEIALNALLWNGKGEFVCIQETVREFYIPGRHRESFLGLASIFSKAKIDDSVSVPTILRALDLESSFITI